MLTRSLFAMLVSIVVMALGVSNAAAQKSVVSIEALPITAADTIGGVPHIPYLLKVDPPTSEFSGVTVTFGGTRIVNFTFRRRAAEQRIAVPFASHDPLEISGASTKVSATVVPSAHSPPRNYQPAASPKNTAVQTVPYRFKPQFSIETIGTKSVNEASDIGQKLSFLLRIFPKIPKDGLYTVRIKTNTGHEERFAVAGNTNKQTLEIDYEHFRDAAVPIKKRFSATATIQSAPEFIINPWSSATYTILPAPPTLTIQAQVREADDAAVKFDTSQDRKFRYKVTGPNLQEELKFGGRITQTNRFQPAEPIDVRIAPGTIKIVQTPIDKFRAVKGECLIDGDEKPFGNFSAVEQLITVDAPDTGGLVCHFTNEYVGETLPVLIIRQKIDGTLPGIQNNFSYLIDDGSGPPVTRSTSFTASEINQFLSAAPYTLSTVDRTALKITIAGSSGVHDFESVSCRDQNQQPVTYGVGPTGEISGLEISGDGTVVTCDYTFKLQVSRPPPVQPPPVEPPPPQTFGTVYIVKRTTGGDGTFDFTVTPSAGSVQLRAITTTNGAGALDSGMRIRSGATTIAQSRSASYTLVGGSCDNGTEVDIKARTASFDIKADETVVCTFTSKEVTKRTVSIVRSFIRKRLEFITSDTGRPRLIERGKSGTSGVTGEGSGKDGDVSFRASLRDAVGAKGTHKRGLDVWAEGKLSYFKSDALYGGEKTSGHFGVVRVGADYLIAPRFLVGVVGQYDQVREKGRRDEDGFEITGRGFMFGPYAEVQLTDHLYFDAKALWGRSNNKVSPFNTYVDKFGTTRWLTSARLTGTWDLKTSQRGTLNFSPRLEVVYASETSKAYLDSNGIDIASQKLGLGRVNVGPELSYRHVTEAGTRIEPRIAVRGLWSFGDKLGDDDLLERKADRFQVELSGGLGIQTQAGSRIDLEGSYTGLGSAKTRSAGGKVNVTIPLQGR